MIVSIMVCLTMLMIVWYVSGDYGSDHCDCRSANKVMIVVMIVEMIVVMIELT